MDKTNSIVYIYDLGFSLLSPNQDKAAVLEELKSIRNDVEGEVAEFLIKELIDKGEKLLSASEETKKDIENEISLFLSQNYRYYKKAKNISISLNFEDSPLGFANGTLEMYDMYQNNDILTNDIQDGLSQLKKMIIEKAYDPKLYKMIDNLQFAITLGEDKDIKKYLSEIKNYASNLKRADEFIHRLKVCDIIEILEEDKQYIEIFNLSENKDAGVRKIILYSGYSNKNKLSTTYVYERKVIGLRTRIDENNNKNVLDIIVS